MIEPAIPSNEKARLAALKKLRILNTAREIRYDKLAEVARSISGMDIALISLIDETRQWVKAGSGSEGREFPRSQTFCGHTINYDEPLVVPDAKVDNRFHDNPFVTGDPHISAYVGLQLRSSEGLNVGTLCCFDRTRKQLSDEQIVKLRMLADCAMDMMERDAVTSDLETTSKKTILFESVLKAYLPFSTWQAVDKSVERGELVLHDERLHCTVLMADARGFTTYSEKNDPEHVMQVINRYYDSFVSLIFNNGGEINKFIGDAVLVLFESADMALQTAREMQSAAAEIRGELPASDHLHFRIGLHSGNVISGTVGNYIRKEQTVIGDVVNTAARLESYCMPDKIFVSADCWNELTKKPEGAKRYRVKVRGRETELGAYMV